VKVIFWWEGLECSRVAMEYDLYKSLGDVDMCRKFDMFEVQVPIIFFGTVGFSPHRDGRYQNNARKSISLITSHFGWSPR